MLQGNTSVGVRCNEDTRLTLKNPTKKNKLNKFHSGDQFSTELLSQITSDFISTATAQIITESTTLRFKYMEARNG